MTNKTDKIYHDYLAPALEIYHERLFIKAMIIGYEQAKEQVIMELMSGVEEGKGAELIPLLAEIYEKYTDIETMFGAEED